MSYDAGVNGTHLFDDLVRLVSSMKAQRHPAAVTRAAMQHYRNFMVPFFRKHGIVPPPMDELITYEHIATRLHTLNPTHMLVTQIREVNEEIDFYRDHLKKRDPEEGEHPVNHQIGKLLLENRKFLIGLYERGTRKLAFDEVMDGDLLPTQVMSFAPVRDVYALQDRITPGSYGRLRAGMRGGGGTGEGRR